MFSRQVFVLLWYIACDMWKSRYAWGNKSEMICFALPFVISPLSLMPIFFFYFASLLSFQRKFSSIFFLLFFSFLFHSSHLYVCINTCVIFADAIVCQRCHSLTNWCGVVLYMSRMVLSNKQGSFAAFLPKYNRANRKVIKTYVIYHF